MGHIETRTCIKFVPKFKKYKFFNSKLRSENSSEIQNSENSISEKLLLDSTDAINNEIRADDVDPFINIFKGPP